MVNKKFTFVFLSTREAGGMERRYLNLFFYLIDQGFDINILCTKEFYHGFCERGVLIPIERIRFYDYDGSQKRIFRGIRRIISFPSLMLKAHNASRLFFVVNPGIILYCISLFSRTLPDYGFTMANSLLKDYDPKYLPRIVRFSSKVDCLSQDIIGYASKFIEEKDKHKLKLSPCSFINYDLIIESSEREIDVAFVGRFTKGKGLDLLEKIDSQFKNINVHVCGFGSFKPQLDNAHIYRIDNAFATLAKSKIFLSIQQYENYPSQSLLEAMASGCAIIATDVGLTRNILDESCCIFIKYDANDLCQAINYLLDNPNLIKELGDNAKKKSMNEHNVSIYANYFINEFM